jgi:hypothetical protein
MKSSYKILVNKAISKKDFSIWLFEGLYRVGICSLIRIWVCGNDNEYAPEEVQYLIKEFKSIIPVFEGFYKLMNRI